MTLRLRFLGHASFQVVTERGTNVLIDPWLSGDAAFGVPPSPVTMKELGSVDVVLVSHAAVDHRGESFDIVKSTGALLICGPDTRLLAMAEGVPDKQIALGVWGVTHQQKTVTVKVVESHHISFTVTKDGKYITGLPLGFIVATETSEAVYHPGDTSLFSDLKLIGELYHPDIALVGVGGLRHLGRDIVEMSPLEAAITVGWLGSKVAIPMHYLPQNTHEPQEFVEHLRVRSPLTRPVILRAGESFEYARA